MITAKKSATGDPLMVGGPQIGYQWAHRCRPAHAQQDRLWSRHWLTATDRRELRRAVRILDRAGDDEFGYAIADDKALPERIGGYERDGVERVPFLPGYMLRVGTYRRA